MGLALQAGNQVTISYRQDSFRRIKERNARRLGDAVRAGKLEVIFNSAPVEFKPETVVLDVAGSFREIANDYVWIFAGGTPPNEFLKRIGVQFGSRDMTILASTEAHLAVP